MTSTPRGAALTSRTLPHRLVAVLITALFGLTLSLSPIAAPTANAAVTPAVAVRALNVAKAQIGVRYKWGGTNRRTGFDCSGLTQYSYARAGKRIPRTSAAQYRATIHINKRYARVGDLIFFASGGRVHHVGIYAGHGYMVDAPHSGTRVQKRKIWTSAFLVGRVR